MYRTTRRQAGPGGGLGIRLIIGLVIAAFAVISYFMSSEYNPVTDSEQHLSLTPQQEIALGLQSVPQLVQEFGGLYPDDQVQGQIDQIGQNLVNNIRLEDLPPWEFEFYVLDDSDTINAFALPGGPVFITTALLHGELFPRVKVTTHRRDRNTGILE